MWDKVSLCCKREIRRIVVFIPFPSSHTLHYVTLHYITLHYGKVYHLTVKSCEVLVECIPLDPSRD